MLGLGMRAVYSSRHLVGGFLRCFFWMQVIRYCWPFFGLLLQKVVQLQYSKPLALDLDLPCPCLLIFRALSASTRKNNTTPAFRAPNGEALSGYYSQVFLAMVGRASFRLHQSHRRCVHRRCQRPCAFEFKFRKSTFLQYMMHDGGNMIWSLVALSSLGGLARPVLCRTCRRHLTPRRNRASSCVGLMRHALVNIRSAASDR